MYIPQAPPTIGTRIKRERTERGISRETLAEMAGISAQTLWLIEHERTKRPRKGTLTDIALSLGIEPRVLRNAAESRRRYEKERNE